MIQRVFISYASSDKKFAEALLRGLKAAGHDVWMAPDSIPSGAEYATAIMQGLTQSDLVVLLLSRASNSSQFVRKEMERAVASEKRIIPVRLEAVLPSGGLEYLISELQWVDANETLNEIGVARIVDTVFRGDAARVRGIERGVLHLNGARIFFGVAAIAILVAVVGRLIGAQLPASGVALLLGLGLLAALLGAVLQLRGWRPGKKLVVRRGDIAIVVVLLVSAGISAAQLLFVPLLTALIFLALYFLSRNVMAGRGVVVGLLGTLALVGALWAGEGLFYRSLSARAHTFLFLPDRCLRCDEIGQEVYVQLVDLVRRSAADSGGRLHIYPDRVDALPRNYDALVRTSEGVGPRPLMLARTILRHGDVFDDVIRVSLQTSRAACGRGRTLVNFTLSAWQAGDRPAWSSWDWDASGPGVADLRARLSVTEGRADDRDGESAAYLLTTGVFSRLTTNRPGNADVWQASRAFLRQYYRDIDISALPSSAETRSAIALGAAEGATQAQTRAALSALTAELQQALSIDVGDCEAIRRNERSLLSARYGDDIDRLIDRADAGDEVDPEESLTEDEFVEAPPAPDALVPATEGNP